VKPIALADVLETRRHTDLPVIGTGGISTWQDAVEMLMAGATAVGLHTAALVEGPYVVNRIVLGLEEYLKRKEFDGLDAIRGLGLKRLGEETVKEYEYAVELNSLLCDGCTKCEMSCLYGVWVMCGCVPPKRHQNWENMTILMKASPYQIPNGHTTEKA